MTNTPGLRFSIGSVALLASSLALVACGSSANTYTSPSGVPKCAVNIEAPGSTVPAAGGAGSIIVKTARECQWTAQPDASWLAITAGSSGQGDGTVQFGAAPNPDPVQRTGGIMLNGQRAAISQAAAECRFELPSTSASLPPSGGSGSVAVRASSALCEWTAAAGADWITIVSGASGRGSSAVTFTVAPTSGPPRTGTITAAGLAFSVFQSEQCAYAIAPQAYSTSASGGSSVVTVTAGEACPWTAASNVPWVSIATTSGSGPGSVAFTVAPTSGPSRTGTVTIAGHAFTVTQAPGCSFAVAPSNHTADASGGTRTVTVTAAPGCGWSAASAAPWITLSGPTTGNGSGEVIFTIAPTTGPSRTGTVTVAGQIVTVVQGQGCTYGISPETQNLPASGGDGTVTVTSGAGCAWTSSSNAPWLTITSGASGSGAGSVGFRAAATDGPARSGTLTIAGRTFTVNQGQGCTFSLSSTSASAPSSGTTGAFDVRSANGCAWTATSNASWLTITAGASGSGNGTVRYAVAPNTGPQRSGTMTAGGQTFTVNQDAGCSYSVSPASQDVGSGGGTTTVAVTAPAGCSWSATSSASWIGISSGNTGAGNGSVELVVGANSGGPREGQVTVNGQNARILQASGCAFSLNPTGQSVPTEGGSGSFTVNTAATCEWRATTDAPWLSITSGSGGNGSGAVQFAAAPNSGGSRSGAINVAGQIFTVTQAPSCSAVVAPETMTAPAAGGPLNVSISMPPECSWSAASNAPWLAITSAAGGTGSGSVQLDAQANTGPARSGTAMIAGRTVTVNQDAGCTVSLAPPSQAVPIEGGSGSVAVTTAAGCAWTATSNVPWITVTAGASGTGDGTVQFTVGANATGAARTGTVTIGGQTFTVIQAGPEGA